MRFVLLSFVALISISLSACSVADAQTEVEEFVGYAAETMQSTYEAMHQYMADLLGTAQVIKEDVDQRVEKVNEGLKMIQDGKQKLQEGLGGGEEEEKEEEEQEDENS